MNNAETIDKVYSACFGQAMFLFRIHYENAKNHSLRKAILDFDWNSMLFDEIVKKPEEYGNSTNVRIYKMITEKKHFNLYVYFMKNKIYNILKKIKRSILGQG